MRYHFSIKRSGASLRKGEIAMKTNNAIYRHSSHYCPAYPNEADTSYYQKKLLELLGKLLSGVMLVFWLVLMVKIS